MDSALGGARRTGGGVGGAGGRDKPYAMGGGGASAWTLLASSVVEDDHVGAVGGGTAGGVPPPPQGHFLEVCFLCRKPLASNRDVFMYRGDIPFCTEECRREQIEMDEVMERKETRTKNKVAQRAPSPKVARESPARPQKARAGSIVAG